jgi:hypothetical protein
MSADDDVVKVVLQERFLLFECFAASQFFALRSWFFLCHVALPTWVFTFTLRGRISGARNGNKIHLLALHVNELVRRAQGVAISAPPASYFTPQFQSFPHLQKNTIISP